MFKIAWRWLRLQTGGIHDDLVVALGSTSAASSTGLVAVATTLGVRIWNQANPNEAGLLASETPSKVDIVAFSGDGTLLITGQRINAPHFHCRIAVWRMNTRDRIKKWTLLKSCPSGLSVNDDGSLLALGEDKSVEVDYPAIEIWDARRGAQLNTTVE